MNKAEILKYYSQSHIQNAMLAIAKGREVVGSFRDGAYTKRPDVLLYSRDILERVRNGVVAFHCSVEHWTQPMALSANLKRQDLDNLRNGFDLILDIDAKAKFSHARIAACVVCDFLADFGITPGVKFSGRRGFHIAIAKKAFPPTVDFGPVSIRYPEVPQAIATFIREKIRDRLLEALIEEEGGIAALTKCMPDISELNPYAFIDIEKEWGSRHLFRMPYSLHEKTWLVSMPIKLYKLKKFKPETARPKAIKSTISFLTNKEGEATELLVQALDWTAKHMLEPEQKIMKKISIKSPIPEQFFPPCIKTILNGLRDGKKRSIFTLVSFLRSVNWDFDKIAQTLQSWNSKNIPPLSSRILSTQLKWHERQPKTLLPANCSSELFYRSLGICRPDENCGKNPVNYAFKAFKTQLKSRKYNK